MITHYGYTDGSGEYFIVIDDDRCDGCGDCVENCPQGALEIVTELIDLEDKAVAAVAEEHRRKIRYTCASCKPETGWTPCVLSCKSGAVGCVWKPAQPNPEDA
jgi:NAD-dependent dihydropyrimidine dehydrogenase PreA subunit